MDELALARRVRLRHALRCAIGGASVAAVGLTTSVFNGCFGSVLFYISTIAGTPHFYQGFQLRSIALMFTGAIFGLLSYAIVVVSANTDRTASFFIALPFIAFFSILRADATLAPMPPIANVTLGLLLISRIDEGRDKIARNMLSFFLEIVVAWVFATAVNFVFPDRATEVGRRLAARELRRLGSVISSVAGCAFSTPVEPSVLRPQLLQRPVRALSSSPLIEVSHTMDVPVYVDLSYPPTDERRNASETFSFFFNTHNRSLEVTGDMMRSAATSLQYLHQLPPFGSTRVSEYANLANARVLLESSVFEPRLLPEASSRWRNVAAWREVIEAISTLVNKVSCLESVIYLQREQNKKFDQAKFANFLGQAYVPLWISHLAACAASCATMSQLVSHATCAELMSNMSQHDNIDPRAWRARRAEMYFGFLWHSRLMARNRAQIEGSMGYDEMRNLEPPSIRPLDLHYNVFKPRYSAVDSDIETTENDPHPQDTDQRKQGELDVHSMSLAERRMLSFFAIECHSLAEQIGHTQRAMMALAATSNTRGWFAPFYFLISPFSPIRERIRVIWSMNMPAWEVKFAFTHFLLLACLLAFAFYLPLGRFEQSEIAWAYTSAALAAQLSAEPTLFIGLWRVIATITGSILGFGFSSLLKAVDNSTNSTIHLWVIPYMFLVILVCLLLVPLSHRYAAFLIIVTNAVMLLCPRATADCRNISSETGGACFPDWKYAISRSANVSIGVVFAVVFHLLFWPRYANVVVLRTLSIALKNAVRVMHGLRTIYFSFGLNQPADKSQSTARQTNEEQAPPDIESRNGKDHLTAGDVFEKNPSVIQEVQQRVGKYISASAQTVKSEASVFRTGPLGLRPLLSDLLPDFIALNVTLSELASILGRRPIFSPSYGRTVFKKLIRPMLSEYETIQISLNNLACNASETVQTGSRQISALRENGFDLYQALVHLARCRSELRRGACDRAASLGTLGVLDSNVRQRLSYWSLSPEERQSGNFCFDKVLDAELFRDGRLSVDDSDCLQDRNRHHRLHIDDVIMYDAFTFIAEASLSTFVRIALTILQDAEAKLQAKSDPLEKKQK